MEYQLFLGKENNNYYAAAPELGSAFAVGTSREEVTNEIIKQANEFLLIYDGIPSKMGFEEANDIVGNLSPTQMHVMEYLYYNASTDTINAHPRTERSLNDPELNLPGDVDCPDCPDKDSDD
jgi:hypothetical protein